VIELIKNAIAVGKFLKDVATDGVQGTTYKATVGREHAPDQPLSRRS
jgi:hypothetical protein